METPELFYIKPSARHPSRVVRTVYKNETELINDLLWLHNESKGIHLDPCYSIGRFWRNLPSPRIKMDINPQAEGVIKANCCCLPIKDSSIDSIMFDPPFLLEASKNCKLRERFSTFAHLRDLKEMYFQSLREFWRVLVKKGVLVFKCQDVVFWHRQFLAHCWIIGEAEEIGFYAKDLFILVRDQVLLSAHVNKQEHARKTHTYYLVFNKPNKRG